MLYKGEVGSFYVSKNIITPTNKTDCHDTTEILLKVALNTITLTHNSPYINPNLIVFFLYFFHKVISFIGLYF
jgi:hypothetical protein